MSSDPNRGGSGRGGSSSSSSRSNSNLHHDVNSSDLLNQQNQHQHQHHHQRTSFEGLTSHQHQPISVLSLQQNQSGSSNNNNQDDDQSGYSTGGGSSSPHHNFPPRRVLVSGSGSSGGAGERSSGGQFRPISSSASSSSSLGNTRQQRELTPPGVDQDVPSVPPPTSGGNQQQQSHHHHHVIQVTATNRPPLTSSSSSNSNRGLLPAAPPGFSESSTNNNHKYDHLDVFASSSSIDPRKKSTGTSSSSAAQQLKQNVVASSSSSPLPSTTPGSSSSCSSAFQKQQHHPTVGDLEHQYQQQQHQQQQRKSSHHSGGRSGFEEFSYSNNHSNNNNEDSAAPPLDDAVFVRECVFAMLACDSLQFSRWDSQTQQYTNMSSNSSSSSSSSSSAASASPRQRDIYDRFALKLGTIRRRIQIHLGNPSSSFLQQSLRRAVERQLVSYSRFISSLSDNNNNQKQNSSSSSKTATTIGDIQVACIRALPKLAALLTVLQQSESTKGGELVSKLDALNHHGGEELSKLMHEVYRETVTPLLYMTLQWLTKGTCSDPYSEFFVHVNAAIPESSDRYWSDRFSLQSQMIPLTVFTREQAHNILLAGKNINFLQKCCRVRDWRMKQSVVDAAQDASFENVDGVIQAAVADTNASVMKVLNDKFSLLQAFQRARLIYLLANGDFTSVIMNKLDPHLSHPANLVSTTAVQDALHAAVTSMSNLLPSCMDSAAPHILAEISIPQTPNQQQQQQQQSVQQDGGGSGNQQQKNSPYTGWDVFSMSLPFPPPYNCFFTTETLRVYRRLFRLLWKVKRAEVELKKSWQLFTAADRKFVNSRPVPTTTTNNEDNSNEDSSTSTSATSAAAGGGKKGSNKNKNNNNNNNQQQEQKTPAESTQQRLRQLNAMAFKHLTHFVNNFQMYLVTEVIEIAWQKLTAELTKCSSVDNILTAHNNYLSSMLQFALLRDSTVHVSNLLNKMLNVALEFCASYRNTMTATYGAGSTSSLLNQQQQQNQNQQQQIPTTPTPSASQAITRCQRSITMIETGIGELLNILEEDEAQGVGGGGQKLEFLQSLGSRLNFNYFYRQSDQNANSRSSSIASNTSSASAAAAAGSSARGGGGGTRYLF